MTIQDRYRPRSLAEIVGQPSIYKLMLLAAKPRRSCWMLEGEPGTGKSETARVFAEDLGCSLFSKHVFNASRLKIEVAEKLFNETVRSIPMDGAPMHVVILEELERCASNEVGVFLKTALDCNADADNGGMARRLILIATSNDVTQIKKGNPALLERFSLIHFSSGPEFALACQERLAAIWEAERPGEDIPEGWLLWGWDDGFTRFSMRMALRELADCIEAMELVAA